MKQTSRGVALLVVIIALVLSVVVALVLNAQRGKQGINDTDVDQIKIIIDACTQDTDCIVVDFNDCCRSKKAINKSYEDEYYKHPEWQRPSADRLEFCKLVECDDETRGYDFSKCVNNRCVLVNSKGQMLENLQVQD